MKAKCIKPETLRYLTNRKEYRIVEIKGIFISIIDDSGMENTYYKDRFEIISLPHQKGMMNDVLSILR